jgi:hypothetical protein
MKRLWRWLGFHVHEWGPWERIDVNTILVSPGGQREFCNVSAQARKCLRCGYLEKEEL